MNFKKTIVGLFILLGLTFCSWWLTLDKETRGLLKTVPTNRDLLFWTQAQRDAAFRALDRLPILAKAHDIPAGNTPSPLPNGPELKLPIDIDQYMAGQRSAALIILQDGKVRFEKYRLDFDKQGRWTSFSVAKSFTATLIGAAIQDGYINSMDDKVSQYIPEMKGSAYDDVSIRQLMTMTSGVQWNEHYNDKNSDVAKFMDHQPEKGVDTFISYMRQLPRKNPAGELWHYSTGETNLVGALLEKATKKPLAQYLSEKVWIPLGMEQKGTWLLNKTGLEISGCCIQAAARDYARFGQFILDGAMINGQSILPEGWLKEATSKRVSITAKELAELGIEKREDLFEKDLGYGYFWWIYSDGSYGAQGIFGQGIFIDPQRKLVIVSNADWDKANDQQSSDARTTFYQAVQKAVDAETNKN